MVVDRVWRFFCSVRAAVVEIAVLALLAWAATGYLAALGPGYFAVLAAVAGHLAWQILLLKPGDPADCLMRFKSNAHLGLLLTAGVIAGSLTACETAPRKVRSMRYSEP